jgi:flagellar hook-associated protein 1 FlgK
VGSDFFGLQVGMSALNAARRQMEVAAQNVANANTDGYTRQRVELATVGASTTAAVHARSVGAGSGVQIVGVTRLRDQFLQTRSLSEHEANAYLGRSQTLMSRVELAFNEPSDSGIQSQLADFWAGWEDVANTPGNIAGRSQLLQRASTLATSINQAGNDLQALWQTSNEQLATVVTGVNAAATRVGELNGAIKRAVAAGLSPNELLDQRDLLVQDLAERIGGKLQYADLGQVNVFVGGSALVRGEQVELLSLDTNGSNITTAYDDPTTTADTPVPVIVRWVKDGFAADVTGGEAGALLAAANVTLPTYRHDLDAFAQQLASAVNTQHALGLDLNGHSPTGNPTVQHPLDVPATDAYDFFTWTQTDGLLVAITDPTKIAASTPTITPPATLPDAAKLDGSNALAIADIASSTTGPDQAYRTLIIRLGVETQTVNRRVDIQNDIMNQVDSARDSESGVSIDEEMANMIAYQHTYGAASRMITAIDEMLNRLINGTGLVGRG